jgi:Tol biopolymer transport system component
MPIRIRALFIMLAFGLLPHLGNAQFYYGLHQTFGKNRVQYNEFAWTYYRYEQFDVYFYKGGKPIAQKASVMTNRNLARMQRFLDHTLDQRIRIMVFNSLTDLKQSNLNASDDESYNTGGVTRTAGTRMFVYFDGDYAHLEQQIREGLAYLVVSNMLYGGFTSAIKNSTLLNLPAWYTEGLISYLSTPWNPTIDEQVMDGFTSGKYKRLNSLTGEEARYCGHAIWNYIAYTYGDGVIKNLLYMTIINRSVDRAMAQVLGTPLGEFTNSWRKYYAARYQSTFAAEEIAGEEIIRSKKEERIFQPRLSKNGRYLAYASNDQGLYKVFVYDLVKKKKKKVFKRGFRIAQNNDYSYPLLAWHPNNRIVASITEEKGFIWLYFYDVEKKKLEKKALFGFQKILSVEYSRNGKELLLSAVKDGKSDIFVYTILSTSIEQVTDDDYTDLHPTFFNNDKQIVFSSNRVDDSLRTNEEVWNFRQNNDLFVYNRTKKDNKILWRLTNTPAENEVQPVEYEHGYLSFLSNPTDLQERYIIAVDSSIAYVDTTTHYAYSFKRYKASAYTRNIADEDFSVDGERIISLYYKDKRFRIYDSDFIEANEMSLIDDEANRDKEREANANRKKIYADFDVTDNTTIEDITKVEIDINDYQFDPSLVGDYGPPKTKKPPSTPQKAIVKSNPIEQDEDEEYIFPPARNYFLTFLRDNFTAKIDFMFDNPQYQTFTGVPDNTLLNAGFNVQFKVGAVDLMNDYRLVAGFRTDFQPVPGLSLSPNSEIILGLVNHKKRLNKELTMNLRSQLTTLSDFFLYRLITYEAHMKFIWPFNEVQSIRGSFGWRNQRGIVLSDSPVSLPLPDQFTDYGILKAAFVHDNTRMLDINIYKGTRYKVFTEYYRNFSIGNSGMHTLGIDFRNYIPIHRTLIFATRFAAGTSFGPEKLIHYLGGVDNAVNPSLNTETPISQTENYRFQTVITNMRGFRQNVRNGNSFAVINGEVRLPIFKYLINRPIRSDFISSFQVVGFGDVGTAWNGPSPWSDENAFNNRTITSGNLEVIINRQTNPIVGGYGIGLRTRLLGYFVRADWAWGVENGVILDNIFYFSLSTDF